MPMGEILIGTSSWTDPTLLSSGWYPESVATPEQRLAFYADQFPLVEVDSTYYAMPSERNAGLWTERTPVHFTFDIKAFGLLTQHPAQMRGIPKKIRETLPDASKARIYAKDLTPEAMEEIWSMFASALMPLHSAGKLGAVFFQFPEWFVPSKENKAYLGTLRARLPDYTIAVEFRRGTWMEPEDRARSTVALLRDHGLSYVCVDMPQGFDSSVPPIAEVTNPDLAVVRFHGRNTESWKKKGLTTAERFDYLYSESELLQWRPKIDGLAQQAREVHVLFNNCFGDKAQRNASQLAGLVREQRAGLVTEEE